ncbi:MAG TPA: ABC transporter ATP-binding protein [Chloroflexota bacterium]|nr:ABC transporter ATP-binding protein [Chloroflexota bacterium]
MAERLCSLPWGDDGAVAPRGVQLEFRGVTCSYDGPPVLQDITLRIAPGQLVGLVGPSGSGKTTFLKAALGLVKPVAGMVLIDGQPVGRCRALLGYVPQVETVDWSFPVTVEEVVLMGRAMALGPWPWTSRRARTEARVLLARLGLAGLERRHIRELSGGQQQRVFLARALFRQPRLLLLDEPTSGVDIRTRHEILHLLAELQAQGTTIVLSTHELNAVATHLPYLVCLNRTVIAHGPPSVVFRDEVLSRLYNAPLRVVREGDVAVVIDHPWPTTPAAAVQESPSRRSS